MASLLVTVVAFDACFWKARALGASLAVFFAVLSVVLLVNREKKPDRGIALLLLLMFGTIVAAIIETSFANCVVLLCLTIEIAGGTYYQGVSSLWGRCLSQIVALVRAPGRVFWLAGQLLNAAFADGFDWAGSVFGGGLMVLPAVFLALVFGSLLASGNVIFEHWTDNIFDWLWKELAIYLDGERIALWTFVAAAALPLLRPVSVSSWWWSWTQRLPRIPEIVPARAALLSSASILVVLNLLFLMANVADAIFLWGNHALPAGVTYSSFVHNGVNSLVATVLLSAFVLTGIFQQMPNVSQCRSLKVLGLAWVGQNLFLLLSVLLRLQLYIEAYDMTVLRLGVIIFLLLVGAGYGLLTIKIMREKSLSWLVGGCVLAIIATFYITQFLDLAGWSANYNVARWEKDKSRNLDVSYLYHLGPAAWPAIRRASDGGANWDFPVPLLSTIRNDEASQPRAEIDERHWREFSLRAYWNRATPDDKK